MRVEDLKLTDGTWTNDTGASVEINPPGIVVLAGEWIAIDPESGAIALHPASHAKPAPAAPPEDDTSKKKSKRDS